MEIKKKPWGRKRNSKQRVAEQRCYEEGKEWKRGENFSGDGGGKKMLRKERG